MTLEDYARIYARRCAVRTTFKFVRPLMAYRVSDVANDICPALSHAGAKARGFSPLPARHTDPTIHHPAPNTGDAA